MGWLFPVTTKAGESAGSKQLNALHLPLLPWAFCKPFFLSRNPANFWVEPIEGLHDTGMFILVLKEIYALIFCSLEAGSQQPRDWDPFREWKALCSCHLMFEWHPRKQQAHFGFPWGAEPGWDPSGQSSREVPPKSGECVGRGWTAWRRKQGSRRRY